MLYDCTLFGFCQENEWEEEWNIDKCSHNSLMHNLQNVMLYGRVTDPYVIWLIEYLIGHACALEKIVISDKRDFTRTRGSWPTYYFHGKEAYTSNQLVEFLKKLLSFPRIRRRAVVLLE